MLFEVTALASSQVTINDVIQTNKKFFLITFFLLSFPTLQVSSEFAYKQNACCLPPPRFTLHMVFFHSHVAFFPSLFILLSLYSHVAFLPLSLSCLPSILMLPFFLSHHVAFSPLSLNCLSSILMLPFFLPPSSSCLPLTLHVTMYYKYSHITFICSLW